MTEVIEFLRLNAVMQRVGLSKSEIYRRVAMGKFPKPRRYPDSDKSYWLASEITQWQRQALGIECV